MKLKDRPFPGGWQWIFLLPQPVRAGKEQAGEQAALGGCGQAWAGLQASIKHRVRCGRGRPSHGAGRRAASAAEDASRLRWRLSCCPHELATAWLHRHRLMDPVRRKHACACTWLGLTRGESPEKQKAAGVGAHLGVSLCRPARLAALSSPLLFPSSSLPVLPAANTRRLKISSEVACFRKMQSLSNAR